MHFNRYEEFIMLDPLALLFKYHHETFRHSMRVADLAYHFGEHLHLSNPECLQLYNIGASHDCGKLKVPLQILSKPGKLTDREYEEIKKHPIYSCDIIKEFSFRADQNMLDAVLFHHENIDGSGYYNLFENDIPFQAKLIRIVDSYDTLLNGRSYMKGMSYEKVLHELGQGSGSLYDHLLLEEFNDFIEQKHFVRTVS